MELYPPFTRAMNSPNWKFAFLIDNLKWFFKFVNNLCLILKHSHSFGGGAQLITFLHCQKFFAKSYLNVEFVVVLYSICEEFVHSITALYSILPHSCLFITIQSSQKLLILAWKHHKCVSCSYHSWMIHTMFIALSSCYHDCFVHPPDQFATNVYILGQINTNSFNFQFGVNLHICGHSEWVALVLTQLQMQN